MPEKKEKKTRKKAPIYKDVRYDKDIRRNYLQGRLGGVPQLLVGASFPGGTEEGPS